MKIFLLILLFSSFVFTTNALWYVKRPEQKPYPSPGKRSLPDEETNSVEIDCSRSYTHMRSYEQQIAWILTCIYDQIPLPSNSNDIEPESRLASRPNLYDNRSPHVSSSKSNSMKKLLLKLRQRRMKNK